MIPKISAFFQRTRKFQQVREIDNEYEQALLRVVIALIIFVHLLLISDLDKSSSSQKAVLIFSGIWFVYAVLLERMVSLSQKSSRIRQSFAMVADLGAVTFGMLMTQETGTLFYGIYLWVIIGNGIRYGTKALIKSHVLSVVGFTGVILTNDFWSAHSTLAIGLLLTLILIPLYTLKLLERLNQAITHAEEASKAKTHFLAHMSHEMRTPLNGVIGASDLILGTPLNTEQKDLVQTLINSGQILRKLIENVLDFSKIESGKLVAETVDFDLHGMVNGIMDMFAPQAEQKGLRLHTHFSAETSFLLRGDVLHLRQVIINLVGNAIKFTNKGMVELRVSTLSQDEAASRLRFEVIDTGIGIAQGSQQAVFESFTQADAAITRKYGGTGLGTTIAKQLVQFMGGQIGFTSEAGAGCVFWFELPFEKQPSSHIADPMPTLSQVYIIDAGMNAEERAAITSHLAEWGARFDHASSVAGLFSRLALIHQEVQQKFVVLFAPQGIGMGAREFAAHVWADFSPDNVSLILLDPDIYSNTEEELLGMGYSCLLKTPIDKSLLFNALHGVAAIQPTADVISLRQHYEQKNLKESGLDILVADDNGTNRKIISKILERGGHRVDLVENGDEALDLLENKKFDLTILDMYMPVMGGLEAAKIYRVTARQESRMPIIMLTANATVEARRECEEAGIDAFLTKPIDALTLLDTVARLTAVKYSGSTEFAAALVEPTTRVDGVPLLNEDTLRRLELLGDGGDFVDTVIQGFISEGEQLLEAMGAMLLKHEYRSFKELAHTLKGSAGNVGADALFQICREILQLDQADLQVSANSLLSNALDSFNSTRLALTQHMERDALSFAVRPSDP